MIKERDTALVQGRVNRLWIPRRATHHLIVGESGAGKTGLIRDVIMPMCARDKVLFIDVKNDSDEMLAGWGRAIGPTEVIKAFTEAGGGPSNTWFRLVIDPLNDRDRAREAVKEALTLALEIGDIIIACDESRSITERAQLGVNVDYERLITQGRSKGVSVISATAATDNIYPAIKTQWSFAWVGAINGTETIIETLKILGLPHNMNVNGAPNPLHESLRDLQRYQWLYVDKEGAGASRYCLAIVRSWKPDESEMT